MTPASGGKTDVLPVRGISENNDGSSAKVVSVFEDLNKFMVVVSR